MITAPFRPATGGRAFVARRLLLMAATTAVTMVLATATIVASTPEDADAAPAGRPLGVDVSVYQHPNGQPIDWKRVRRYGVRFAIVKATEGPGKSGKYYTNSWFRRDWDGAIAAGIATGAYHYARPRLPIWTAAQDARHFVNTVGKGISSAGMPPVLDLEESGGLSAGNVQAWARTFLAEVQRLSGRQPMIYSALWFWNSFMGATNQFSQYPLWLANYAQTPGLIPGGWTGWNLWQYTGHGRVPGIPGEVDVNVSCGSGSNLLARCPGTRYATWATQYYNRLWKEEQARAAAAKANTSTTKKPSASKTTPTTKKPTSKATPTTKKKSTTPTTKKPTAAKTTPTTKKPTSSKTSPTTKARTSR